MKNTEWIKMNEITEILECLLWEIIDRTRPNNPYDDKRSIKQLRNILNRYLIIKDFWIE